VTEVREMKQRVIENKNITNCSLSYMLLFNITTNELLFFLKES